MNIQGKQDFYSSSIFLKNILLFDNKTLNELLKKRNVYRNIWRELSTDLSFSLVKASGNGSKLSEQRGRGGLRVTSRGEQTNKVFARIQQRFRAICRIIRLIGSSTYKRTPVNGEFASNPFSRATLVECIIITRSAGFRASSLC